jgi:CAAX protease family protein
MQSPRSSRGLLLFLLLLVVFCAAAYAPIVRARSLHSLGGISILLIMWAPGAAAIGTALVVFRSLRPCGFTLSRRALPWMVGALVIPLSYALLIHGLLSALGYVQLGTKNVSMVFVLIGLLLSLLTATGEEIGWRGFLAPVMAERFGFLRGNLLVGLLWATYHVPAMWFASYADKPGIAGVSCFVITMVGLSLFLGHVRLATNCVWPAALFHAAHNLFFLGLFEPVRPLTPSARFLQGETGLPLAVVALAIGAWSVRRRARAAALA